MPRALPYRFEPQESGGVLGQFVDVPEAHTFGASEADAGGATRGTVRSRRSAATSGSAAALRTHGLLTS